MKGDESEDWRRARGGTPFKVAVHGRPKAIQKFEDALVASDGLHTQQWKLSGTRLVCPGLPRGSPDCSPSSALAFGL